jgi:hypothetical protein
VLAVAGAVDVDAQRAQCEAIEDGRGESGIAEVLAHSLSLMLELSAVETRVWRLSIRAKRVCAAVGRTYDRLRAAGETVVAALPEAEAVHLWLLPVIPAVGALAAGYLTASPRRPRAVAAMR